MKVKCPECGAINKVECDYTDMDDMSKEDVDGMTCYSCKKESFLESAYEVYKVIGIDLRKGDESINIVDGEEYI